MKLNLTIKFDGFRRGLFTRFKGDGVIVSPYQKYRNSWLLLLSLSFNGKTFWAKIIFRHARDNISKRRRFAVPTHQPSFLYFFYWRLYWVWLRAATWTNMKKGGYG